MPFCCKIYKCIFCLLAFIKKFTVLHFYEIMDNKCCFSIEFICVVVGNKISLLRNQANIYLDFYLMVDKNNFTTML